MAPEAQRPVDQERMLERLGGFLVPNFPSTSLTMIYFVRADEYVKIGVARNIQTRMNALQTGCPQELECGLLLRGSYDLEDQIHRKFWSAHHRGEWFVWTENLADFVREMRDSGKDLSGLVAFQAP